MSSIVALKGKKVTKTVKFNGGQVEISKLTIAQVFEIQKMSGEEKSEDPLQIPKALIRMSVSGGSELLEEDFAEFPLDDINTLSEDIMQFSGLKNAEAGKG